MSYVLTCCSTADLPKEHFEKRNIPYTCFHFMMDGTEYPDDLGQTIAFDDFYKRIENGAKPTTSQVSPEQFTEFFESFLKEGKDVLHVTLSGGISGTYNSAVTAANGLAEKYPDRKIYVVDSLAASSGYGLLMDMAADRRDEGMDIDGLRAWIENNRLKIHHWFFSTDLTSYYRGGRITKTSLLFGTLFHICPLLNVSNEGKLIPRNKYPGKKKVMSEIVKRMIEHADGGREYNGKCFMCQSACYDDARRVADLVEAAFPNLAAPVMINSIGTVIGSHTGPGTVALFFVGDERKN
ncbi:MAG TPA: DegV family protein [Firmicutes bacterium]|nr:DegV family protein [Bacillota bacterium]